MVYLGPAPKIKKYRSVNDILLDAGIFSLVPPPPPPPPRPPKMPIPRTIYGDDFMNVCSDCGSTLIWDIRLTSHNAPIRASLMNWFRRVILRRPSIGCLGDSYGENCENYAGGKDV